MKTKQIFASFALAGLLFSCSSSAGVKELKTEKEKASYAIGVNIAFDLKSAGAEDIDAKVLLQAMEEVFADKPTLMGRQEAGQFLSGYFGALREKAAEKSVGESAAWLEANKSKEGVKTTASGLQYKVLTEGKGKSPKAEDKVRVHYTGTLTNGTKFDSSVDRNEPAEFPLNGVIRGWTEGLQLMKEGAKYEFYIPSDLAYGPQGRPPTIPGNAALVFEVELLKILK